MSTARAGRQRSTSQERRDSLHAMIRQATGGRGSMNFKDPAMMAKMQKALEDSEDEWSDDTDVENARIHTVRSSPDPPPFFRLIHGSDDAGLISLGCASFCMIIGFTIMAADMISSNSITAPGAIVGYIIIFVSLLHVTLATYCFQKIEIGYHQHGKNQKYVKMKTIHCVGAPMMNGCCTSMKYGRVLSKDDDKEEVKVVVEDYQGCRPGGRIYVDAGLGKDKYDDELVYVDKIEKPTTEVHELGKEMERRMKRAINRKKTYTYKSTVGIYEDVRCCCKWY